ncbi:hypothetical protein [Mammaliicoccus sciuri]|uniref:hypothetical protein n=1 Tax=Mammaliicoccus sciuri TaxID=1296 RepID=UPI001FB2644C|nr:hypothetical protein [Mammaliicoccus sciuri]MCJ0942878.1 hypothetical protein [Mammaliicoccus sciuri]
MAKNKKYYIDKMIELSIIIIAANFANSFSIFKFLKITVPFDQYFSIDLAVYIILFQMLYGFLSTLFQRTKIGISFYNNQTSTSENVIKYKFNSDVTTILFDVSLTGKSSVLSKYKIEFNLPYRVHAQADNKSDKSIKINRNKDRISIALKDLVNNKNYLNGDSIPLHFKVIKSDSEVTADIEIQCKPKINLFRKIGVSFNSNKAKFEKG